MISILDSLHQYVPTLTSKESLQLPGSSESVDVTTDQFHYVLFGGDMLTAKRARGGKYIRSNSERGKDRLEGLIPVVEDWHGKVCLLGVSHYVTFMCSNSLIILVLTFTCTPFRSSRNAYTAALLRRMQAPYTSCVTSSTGEMWSRNPPKVSMHVRSFPTCCRGPHPLCSYAGI